MDFHFGHAGNLFEGPYDFQVQKVIGLPQVASGGDSAEKDGKVIRTPVSDEDVLDVPGQFIPHLLDLLADL